VLFAYDFAALYYNLFKDDIFVKFSLLVKKNSFIDFNLFWLNLFIFLADERFYLVFLVETSFLIKMNLPF
jgi:hypothetical protein